MPIRETGPINLNDFNSELSRNDNTELNFQDIATEFSLEPPNYGDTEPGLGFEELRGESKNAFATFVTINPTSIVSASSAGQTTTVSYNSDGNFRINDSNISWVSVVLNSGSESENFENSFDVIIDPQELDAVARNSTIRFESPDMTTVNFNIHQDDNDATLTILYQPTPSSFISYGFNGGQGQYYKIETNPEEQVEWVASLTNPTYFSHRIYNSGNVFTTSNISGTGDEFIEIRALANSNTDSDETSIISVDPTNISDPTPTITARLQRAVQFSVSPAYQIPNGIWYSTDNFNYNESGESLATTYTVTSNYNILSVSDDSSYFSTSLVFGSYSQFKVWPTSINSTQTERSTTVTITMDSVPTSTFELYITQGGAPATEITNVTNPSDWEYNQYGTGQYKSLSFTVTNNFNNNPSVSVVDIANYNFALLSTWETSSWNYDFPVTINGTTHYLIATRKSTASRTGTMSVRAYPILENTGSADKVTNASISVGSTSETSTLTQKYYQPPVYSWGGSVSIPRNTGVVNVTGDNSAGTITLTPSSFDLVTSQTTRTVVVGNIVIPSGYQNAGTAFSQTVNPIQDAADELISISSSTGGGVSGQGENFIITVNTTDIYDTQWEGFITYTDQSNSTNWVQLSAGNTGTGDDEFFVFVDPNYAGSNGYDGTTRYFDIRVDKVGGGVSSNTLSFIQNVGTPPVIAPSVSVSPTSRTWTYSQSGTSQYQTITAYHDGGNAPTSVSFYVSGIHFGLVQHDPNVPVNVTGGPWVAQATSTSGVSSYSVGVYPLTQNSGTSNKEETVTISMGNSGGNNSTTAQMIQGFNIDWETNVSSLSFGTGGGTKTITLTTDLSWTVSVSGDGFSIDTLSGTAGTRYVNVTATQKDLGGSGTVTFSASGQSDIVVSLSQSAAPLEWYYYVNNSSTGETNSTRSISISYLGGSTSIGVYAYRGTTAQSNQFTLSKGSGGTYFGVGTNTSAQNLSASTYTNQNQGASAAELYINFDSNSGNSSDRTALVELSIGGYQAVTFTVTQNGDPGASGGGGGGDKGEQLL